MASRGHLQSGSATSLDNRAFREAVSKMRQDVLEAKAETQGVRDQLNCLIMLVKRAWMGDQAAAIHVGNIVGAAPPKYFTDAEKDEVNAVHKSRAVHRWAMLSIGLLNRHFKELEEQALSAAKRKLQQRQDYLDQQLLRHKQLLRQASGRGLAAAKKSVNPYLEPPSHQAQRPNAAWNARPKSSKPGPSFAGKETDRPRAPVPRQAVPASNMVQHLAGNAQAEREHGLFSASHVVPDRTRAKRPSSGNQKLQDGQRARPKSAVVTTTKVDRPLKYETTRPVSGKPSSTGHGRPRSAKAPVGQRIFEMTEGRAGQANAQPGRYPATEDRELSLYDDAAADGAEGGEPVTDGRAHIAGTHGGASGYRDTVTEGLRQMESMEDDFRRTAKMLQQKLGISGVGAI